MRQQVKLYNAEGITFRSGVRDGWGGKKKLIKKIEDAALKEANEVVDKMIEDKNWVPDNAESRFLLAQTLAIITAEKHTPETAPVPLHDAKTRLQAIKTAWEMVQRKPMSTVVTAEAKAEDFLKALANRE